MATAVAKSKDNFLSALGDKLNDAETADFTTICGSEEIKVHKLVLRLHSGYFDRLFKSQFQEATQNRIELNDDPKAAVSNLVAYLYYFDYSITPGDLRLEKFDAPAEEDSGYEPTNYFPSRMYGHACMYTLAEKYDIPNLKKLAKKKFEECSQDRLNFAIHHLMYLSRFVDDFMDVIPYVYANTAPNELGLRTSIVELWG